MGDPCAGFKDKLYWRPGGSLTSSWCCYAPQERVGGKRRYVSLCGRRSRTTSGGQASRRPEPIFRCGRCDCEETKRRGWDEPGVTLEPQLPPSHPLADV